MSRRTAYSLWHSGLLSAAVCLISGLFLNCAQTGFGLPIHAVPDAPSVPPDVNDDNEDGPTVALNPDPERDWPWQTEVKNISVGVQTGQLFCALHLPYRQADGLSAHGMTFPLLLFSSGGDASQSFIGDYNDILRRIASQGMIVANIAFEGDSATERGKRFIEALDWFESSPDFSGRVDFTRIVFCGHSRGGLAAAYGASLDPRVRFVVGLDATDVVALADDPTFESSVSNRTYLGHAGTQSLFIASSAPPAGVTLPPGMSFAPLVLASAQGHRDLHSGLRTVFQPSDMMHDLWPAGPRAAMTRLLAAWLAWRVIGDEACREYVVGDKAQRALSDGTLLALEHEE